MAVGRERVEAPLAHLDRAALRQRRLTLPQAGPWGHREAAGGKRQRSAVANKPWCCGKHALVLWL